MENPKRKNQAAKFHREVFSLWGKACFFCGGHATDAAHVLNRGTKLGPLRYATPHLARPACRGCHDKQGAGKLAWPTPVLRDAIRAHNEIAKVKIMEPA